MRHSRSRGESEEGLSESSVCDGRLQQLTLRPKTSGKFISTGVEKLLVRGVTYGTFRPDGYGEQYPEPAAVERDFAQMVAAGVNAVRTYTVPPRWLLDLAAEHGLRVMVGHPWEEHVAFLDDRGRGKSIEERVREGVRACAGHPALLCHVVGNEIPSSIVRWHGKRAIERFVERLYRAAKREDPEALVTYVNYPSTEYLELPFLDLVCFNVFLESEVQLAAYLPRLQNIAGDRPLLLTELGLDSARHGEEAQAASLDWQLRTTFAGGCAGAFVFAWTDEWHRGGHEVAEWDFGLTRRDRSAKPALAVVQSAFEAVPFPDEASLPRISAVVCTYNGARTLRQCLEGLAELDYPDYEVIVVDDGSTDAAASIAEEFDVRLVRTPNRGLASARNTGMWAASGEIVAYLDDDARPDRHWLRYLSHGFGSSAHAGIGGPNIPPAGEGTVASCVARSPGGPIHVLLSDTEAEHIPGCNMAFRRDALEEIGGFDPQFRVAGDDVDVCWRLHEAGRTLGFAPAGFVWHHPRRSIRAYWRQQRGYGRAEALLERKWPEKYNAAGHVSWAGRVYGNGNGHGRWRVYYGRWGEAPFQTAHSNGHGSVRSVLSSLPEMPEWYLVIATLAGLAALGAAWRPLLLAVPLLLLALAGLTFRAVDGAGHALRSSPAVRGRRSLALTAFLHLMQPAARLAGRLGYGLTPWRRKRLRGFALPRPQTRSVWSERWHEPSERLTAVEEALRAQRVPTARGGEYDRWDLEARGGVLGAARLRMATEEHGEGRQLFRFRLWPRIPRVALALALVLGALAALTALDGVWLVTGVLGAGALALAAAIVRECGSATAAALRALDREPVAEQHHDLTVDLEQRVASFRPSRPPSLTRADARSDEHPAA